MDLLHWKNIYVKNIGPGHARKVRFQGDLSFTPEKGTPLNGIDFIMNGIDALAPGQEKESQATPRYGIDFNLDEEYPPVSITVTYKDTVGDNHNDEFTLDFNERNFPR